MARVEIVGDSLVLSLNKWERFFSLHRDIRIERTALESQVRVSDPWNRRTIRGFRAPGTAIPFLILLGTMRYRGGKDFTAIYRRKPVDVYTFNSGEFKRWIVSSS